MSVGFSPRPQRLVGASVIAHVPAPGAASAKLPKPPVIWMAAPAHKYNKRPAGMRIDTVVLHHTGDNGTAQSVGRYFQKSPTKSGAHYIVGKDGAIVQSVSDQNRAWHAGTSSYKGRKDVNDFSIGIEMVNKGDGKDPYTDAQYRALAKLVGFLQDHHGIPAERVVGHRDVALPAGRKIDPAGNFSYKRLFAEIDALRAAQAAPKPPAPKPPAPAPERPQPPAPKPPAPEPPAAPDRPDLLSGLKTAFDRFTRLFA